MTKTKRHSETLLKRKYEATHCYYCETPFENVVTVNQPIKTIDHFIPSYNGGSNKDCNKVICCPNCNALKSNLTPENFLLKIEGHIQNGFTRLKFRNFYPLEKLQTIVNNLNKIIYDRDNNQLNKSGYFFIKRVKNENSSKEGIYRGRTCQPCVFQFS